jgi:hypothetical protein
VLQSTKVRKAQTRIPDMSENKMMSADRDESLTSTLLIPLYYYIMSRPETARLNTENVVLHHHRADTSASTDERRACIVVVGELLLLRRTGRYAHAGRAVGAWRLSPPLHCSRAVPAFSRSIVPGPGASVAVDQRATCAHTSPSERSMGACVPLLLLIAVQMLFSGKCPA